MGWTNWFSDGTGEQMTEKVTVKDDGSTKFESLRTNEGSKENHQHVWISRDSSGNYTADKNGVVAGATSGKSK